MRQSHILNACSYFEIYLQTSYISNSQPLFLYLSFIKKCTKKVNKLVIHLNFIFIFHNLFFLFKLPKNGKLLPFHFKLLKSWEFFPFLTERRIEGGGRGCLLTSLLSVVQITERSEKTTSREKWEVLSGSWGREKKGRKSVELDAAFRRRKNGVVQKTKVRRESVAACCGPVVRTRFGSILVPFLVYTV